MWPVGQAVKTPPFHGDNRGSIPLRVTIFIISKNTYRVDKDFKLTGKIWPIGQVVKTPPSQGDNRGSTPLWVTKIIWVFSSVG